MTQQLSVRQLVAFAFVITFCTLTSSVFAQGVAGSVVTFHNVQTGSQIVIGSPLAPIPIGLDPVGNPWFKNVADPQILVPGPAIVDMFEHIVNVGIEPWTDWHEFLFPAPAGLAPHIWSNVVGLSINGNPIGFSATGLGTQTLDLFNFSQPVLPGEIFSIHKQLEVNGTALVSGAFLRIAEYPTSVPEPASLVIVTICGISIVAIRRH